MKNLILIAFVLFAALAACGGNVSTADPVASVEQHADSFTACMGTPSAIVYLDKDAAAVTVVNQGWRFNCVLTPQGALQQRLATVFCLNLRTDGFTCPFNDPSSHMCCPAEAQLSVEQRPVYAPTYALNRVYDPSKTSLGTYCTTTSGLNGTMIDKCALLASTCGYLYCAAN